MSSWGLIKVACATPELKVADPVYNSRQIIALCDEAYSQDCQIVCFPELCVTAYTAADLFFQNTLQEAAEKALLTIRRASGNWPGLLLAVGAPLRHLGRQYNGAILIQNGCFLAAIPKTWLPNRWEFYEQRWFSPAPAETATIDIAGESVSINRDILFFRLIEEADGLVLSRGCPVSDTRCGRRFGLAVEICEDLWSPDPPSNHLAGDGAHIILNLSASDELVGKAAYRRALIAQQSARLNAAYLYAAADDSESTTDLVFGGHCLIAENGRLLAERLPLEDSPRLLTSVVDLELLEAERLHNAGFAQSEGKAKELSGQKPEAQFTVNPLALLKSRVISATPFVPQDSEDRDAHAAEVLAIQTAGLVKRLKHTGIKRCVVGVSGGLDSTLALLVTIRAYQRLNYPLADIYGITMPGFGTSDRTYQNALALMRAYGLSVKEIPIADAVRLHFAAIDQDDKQHDITYENSQARERTQILMDFANRVGGLVIGTGDMSELALGWCTYNGDHMSMYGVNASVPKTLVQHLVAYQAKRSAEEADGAEESAASSGKGMAASILRDILATPISPELLPPDENGRIAQKTEETTGPYCLHDFFLFYFLRYGFGPEKLFYMARQAFFGEYDDEIILKWLDTFYRRFFAQQFKRSCLPDGPKVGAVSLSPRGDWRMPSDAVADLWRETLAQLKKNAGMN